MANSLRGPRICPSRRERGAQHRQHKLPLARSGLRSWPRSSAAIAVRRIPPIPEKKRASEVHRHKEAVDPGLASAAIVPVEDPVVSILARQRLADGDATDVTIDRVIVVG